MDISLISTSTLTAIAGVITTVFGAIGSWMIAKRQSKKLEDETSANSFKELAEANRLFRQEVKADLQRAQERIAVLEVAIISKDKKILELEYEVQRLRSELDHFKRDGQ